MSNLSPSLAAVSLAGPASTPDRRPLNAQPYDSILDATGARKIVFGQGEVYCRVAHYTDNSGNYEFTCDGRKHNNRGLRQHLFEPRGPHRRCAEVMGILRPEQRHFRGPLTLCIFYSPSRPRQPPPQQHQQQYAQHAHRPVQNQGLYHAHPGWQPFVQQQQQQQQAQPSYAPPPNEGFYQAPLAGQQPPQQQQQQQFTQHAQLIHRPAPNQGFNHAPFWNKPPAQQQQQQNQLAYCPAPNQNTYHTHHPGQVSTQHHQHSQLACRPAQNQGFYNGQHSSQPPAQQQQHQHSELTYRPAPSQGYYHGHLSGQLPAQQQQQQQQQRQQQHHVQQYAQSAANQPNVVPYPAPLISQDLYDLAWAAKLRSEQQQILTIHSGSRSHDFEIVTDGSPPAASERRNPFPQQTVAKALDVASDAAEADIAARRNRDGLAQESVWIDAPEGARILKCFWQRGELYVQPEDGYMFCGYGRWRCREEDVPVSMEVGTVICGCFQRDGELWVQDDPEGEYNRYGFEDEM